MGSGNEATLEALTQPRVIGGASSSEEGVWLMKADITALRGACIPDRTGKLNKIEEKKKKRERER